MRLSRAVGFAVAGLFALTLPGCASMTVNSYAEHGVDFGQYLSYGWAPAEERPTGDPRLDNNPFFYERLQAEVERQLTRRGYLKTTTEQPDLLVHPYVNLHEEVDPNGVDRRAANGYDRRAANLEGNAPEPFVYEAGTLWIDVVDARASRVVWRGWAEGNVEGVLSNQAFMEQKIDEVVARILEKFPRRS